MIHSLVVSAVLLCATSHAGAEVPAVKVRVTSGREYQGDVDQRTNDRELWLRWQKSGVRLERPIAWENVESAEVAGERVAPDELRKRAPELASSVPRVTCRPAASHRSVRPNSAGTPTPAMQTVQSIRCDAWVGSWDSDALTDGILLQVEPLNEFGEVIAATGTLEAELVTVDYLPGYLASTSGGRVPVWLGRWSQPWQTQRRFVQLEFQTRSPEQNRHLDRYALLHVRLTIPGHGVFEQQLDGIRTRPYSPVLNNLFR